MSITVADCLKLPCLREAQVVAGHKGLTKIVTSVSVLESVENKILSDSRIFTANEVIISAFTAIKDSVKAQCKTLEILFNSGDVAVIIYYVGYLVPDVDKAVIAKSDELGLPLIIMPKNRIDISYNEAITEILEAVFNDKYHQTRFINSMLERISQLHESQRNITNIMQMLSDQLKSTLLLYDSFGKSICFAKRSMSGLTSEDMLLDMFKEVKHSKGLEFAEMIGEHNSIAYRLSFGKNPLSHLSLIVLDENNNIDKEDVISAVELLEISYSIWKFRIDSQDISSLIPAILTDNNKRASEIAESYLIQLGKLNSMVIIKHIDDDLSLHDKYTINEKIEELIQRKLKKDGKPVITTIYGEVVIIALNLNNHQYISDMIDHINKKHSDVFFTFFHSINNLEAMKDLYKKYCLYIDSTRIVFPQCGKYTETELEFVKDCTKEIENHQDYSHILSPHLSSDDWNLLIDTLQIYMLDGNKDTKRTAEIMYIHRNTVLYRLRKLKAKLGYDWDRMPDGLIIYKALAIKRIDDSQTKIDSTE